MAGCWTSSLTAFLWTSNLFSFHKNAKKKKKKQSKKQNKTKNKTNKEEEEKNTRGQHSAILTEEDWSIKDLLHGCPKQIFFLQARPL